MGSRSSRDDYTVDTELYYAAVLIGRITYVRPSVRPSLSYGCLFRLKRLVEGKILQEMTYTYSINVNGTKSDTLLVFEFPLLLDALYLHFFFTCHFY